MYSKTRSTMTLSFSCRTSNKTTVPWIGIVCLLLLVQWMPSSLAFSCSSSSSRVSTILPPTTTSALFAAATPTEDDNDSSSSDSSSASTPPLPKRSLVIWDCDGVLVDSEALLKQGEVEGLAQEGFTVTVEDCVRMFSGVSPDQAEENFRKETGRDIPPHFFPEQIANSLELFRQRLKPLMLETVKNLNLRGCPQCIASGSPRERVELCVDVAHMRPYFPPSHVYTRELVSRGKPAPDLFLHAAADKGYAPEECLVIEDSSSGIRAAQAAGMEVLGFLGGGHTRADWYVQEIFDFGIPVVQTEQEVYDYIMDRMDLPSSSSQPKTATTLGGEK